MPLSQLLLEGLAESGDIGGWQERQAKHQSALLDLQEKQRAIADAQRLRELYASGKAPAMNEVMAIDPKFGAEMQKFNNEQLMQQFNMLKAQGDIEETKRKNQEAKQHTFANTLGPLVENWQDSLAGRQPTAQDIESFKGRLGGALKFLDEAYNYKPDVPLDPYDPGHILGTAESLGYSSRRSKTAQEAQLRGLPPTKTAEQAYGSIEMDPVTGQQVRKLPLPSGGGIPQPRTQPQADLSGMSLADGDTGETVPLTAENLPRLKEIYNKIPDPNLKNKVGTYLNQLSQQPTLPLAGSVDRAGYKGKEAEEVKSGQIRAEEEAADKKAMDSYFRSKPPEQVRDLIKESLAGDVEAGLAKLAKTFGVSVPGGGPTAALEVITQQLASTSPFAPGSQSDVEYKARLKKIGDPASNEPVENRLMALDEFYRDQEAFVAQKYEPKSMADILDKRQKGYISEDTARELFRKMKAKKSGAM